MTHWLLQEQVFLGGSTTGPGYAVVAVNKDGTGKRVVFRGDQNSLAAAQAYIAEQGDLPLTDLFLVQAPASTTVGMSPTGPYSIVEGPMKGGALALQNNRWTVTGGGGFSASIFLKDPKTMLIAGVLGGIGAGLVLYATTRRKKR